MSHTYRWIRESRKACLAAGMLLLVNIAGCSSPASISKEDTPVQSAEKENQELPNACGPEGETCADSGTQADVSDFEEISFDDAIAFFEDGKTGILYFGFPDCPWCAEVVPVLDEEAQKAGKTVYYVRTRDDNRERLYTDAQKSAIQPWIETYMKTGDDGEPALYVPLVLAVQNGAVITGHEGTVEGHDAKERSMTEEESGQLKAELQKLIASIHEQGSSD